MTAAKIKSLWLSLERKASSHDPSNADCTSSTNISNASSRLSLSKIKVSRKMVKVKKSLDKCGEIESASTLNMQTVALKCIAVDLILVLKLHVICFKSKATSYLGLLHHICLILITDTWSASLWEDGGLDTRAALSDEHHLWGTDTLKELIPNEHYIQFFTYFNYLVYFPKQLDFPYKYEYTYTREYT